MTRRLRPSRIRVAYRIKKVMRFEVLMLKLRIRHGMRIRTSHARHH